MFATLAALEDLPVEEICFREPRIEQKICGSESSPGISITGELERFGIPDSRPTDGLVLKHGKVILTFNSQDQLKTFLNDQCLFKTKRLLKKEKAALFGERPHKVINFLL